MDIGIAKADINREKCNEENEEAEETDGSCEESNLIELELDDCDEDEVKEEQLPTFSIHALPHKVPFRFKKNSNGNILSIHHTVREEDRVIRVRMGVCCFSERGLSTQFVAIDKRGNVFVFDLTTKRFWKLALIILKASIIVPYRSRENEYITGTKAGQLIILDVARSLVLRASQVSQYPIQDISFPEQSHSQSKRLALLHAGSEAILINLNTLTLTHRLEFDEHRMSLKFACYLPHMEQLFTCFTNDTIHIWSSTSFKTVQTVHPIRIRDRKLRAADPEDSFPVFKLRDCVEDETFQIEACEVENFSEGLIGSYCFSTHGSGLLILTTMDKYILMLNPRTFDVQQIFRLHDFVIKKCAYLPQPNQTLIAVLTTRGKALILDCQNVEFKLIIHSCAVFINVPNDGRLLAVIGNNGEADIWTINCLYNTLVSQRQCIQMLKEAFKQPKPLALSTTNDCFNEDIRKLLKRDRLLSILKEYGFYPPKYRNLIWCSLLKLPCNRPEFQQLLKMDTPLAVKQRSNKIKVNNETLKRMLIKIWSCLANWCKVFGYSDFFPHLIFPFVKMFPKNAVVAFEICVTLLLNHFQLFFEFHPMPPVDYLGMCENVLQYFDSELCGFYAKFSIGAIDFAWPMLSNCFSEVLDDEQWVILWDHIISCSVYFPIYCAVSYNILQREVIMLLPDKQTIDQFFHEKNPIDVMKMVGKAMDLMKKCPKERHPERYFKLFQPIPKNVYPKFLRYPRQWVAKHEDEMLSLHREQEAIEKRIRELELNEHRIMTDLEEGLKKEEYAKRLKEMESLYHDTLKREEERLACQRKLLCAYQKEIRGYKGQVLATLRESECRKRTLELEKQLEMLMHTIERERRRYDSAMILAEDELKNQNFEVLTQRYYLEQQTVTPNLEFKYRNDLRRLIRERRSLRQHLNEFGIPKHITVTSDDCRGSCGSIRDLSEIEQKLDEIQREFLSITQAPKQLEKQ